MTLSTSVPDQTTLPKQRSPINCRFDDCLFIPTTGSALPQNIQPEKIQPMNKGICTRALTEVSGSMLAHSDTAGT
jgi:hypothetical protein